MAVADYNVEVQYLMTWYPNRNDAPTVPQMRGGHFSHNTGDFPDETGKLRTVGGGQDGDPLAHSIVGFIMVKVNAQRRFVINCSLSFGHQPTQKTFMAPPNSVIPFMINAKAVGDAELSGTRAVLHGTIVTDGGIDPFHMGTVQG